MLLTITSGVGGLLLGYALIIGRYPMRKVDWYAVIVGLVGYSIAIVSVYLSAGGK